MQQGLGLWLGVTDPHNYTYSSTSAPHYSVTWPTYAPILDQGETSGCTGFTGADLVNTAGYVGSRLRVEHSKRYLNNEHGLDFYHLNTLADEWPEAYPPVDSGSSILAMAKVLKRLGFITGYSWADNFPAMLDALSKGPVMMGTLWTSDMSEPDSSGLIRPTGDLVGGHAYIARGKNYRKRRIRCRNHWRRDWGLDGEFEVGFDDMEWLLSQQGECVVTLPR